MARTKQGTKVVTAAALAVAALGALVAAPAVEAQPSPVSEPDAPALIVPGRTIAADGSGRVAARRQAEIRADVLRPGRAQRVALDFTAVTLEADLRPMASQAEGWSAWSGPVVDDPEGVATVVRRGDDVAGVVHSPRGSYRIRNAGPGRHLTETVGRFTERKDTLVPPTSAEQPGHEDGHTPAADPTAPPVAGDVPVHPVIDVLVAYTPNALSSWGTVSSVESEAALSIAVTNQAYADSGVNGRVRLAGVTPVAKNFTFVDAWNATASNPGLEALTSTNDGIEDSIHAKRDAVGADLVSVFVDDDDSCGLAWVMTELGNVDRAWGFSLVEIECAVSNLSFPHELGHNMGLNHDHYVDDEGGELFPYAYGHVNRAKGWRTIMAYNNECADFGTYCTRLPRFSNPSQTYNGDPLGRVHTGSNPADNRRALNISHSSISGYRAQTAPFTSWARFVAQQYRDFVGRNPTTAEQNNDAALLRTGAISPQQYIADKKNGAFAAAYAPVARLYFAYFLRSPDKGGLDYWVTKYRTGTPLSAVSSNFAASSEFRNRYGNRTNRAFVELVYQNVLGRAGDPGGITYWTGRLDRRVNTRGQVMIGFSESNEYKRTRASEIETVLVYRGMFQRGATASEFSTAVAALKGGKTVNRLILELLDTPGYAARITA